MNRPIIYIHVGPRRTGTTTIQKNLAKNRRALSLQGFFYPWTNIVAYGHANLIGDIGGFFWYNKKAGGLEALKTEVSERGSLGERRRHIILSTETFADLSTAAPLLKLKAAFDSQYDFKIIPYLRPQTDRLRSLWAAEIMMGNTNERFPVWARKTANNMFSLDYARWLKLYEDVFGPAALCPQIYDKNSSTLFLSFLNACGIEDASEFVLQDDQNLSISHLHAEIFRLLVMIPALNPGKNKARIKALRTSKRAQADYIRDLRGLFNPMPATKQPVREFLKSRGIDESGTLYTPGLYKFIQEKFCDSNAKVARTYFDGGPLFDQIPAPKFIKSNAFAQFSKADIVDLTKLMLEAYRNVSTDPAYVNPRNNKA